MRPLGDIRVLAVTVYLAGPFCSMTLARMGAEVIKVERPGRGDPDRDNGPFAGPNGTHPGRQTDQDLSTRFLKRSRGSKSITLDLKNPKGRDMFLDLAGTADVLLENLAPGSMQRLGLGYAEVSQVNPGIIYCSISGYGQTGPYAGKPAQDPQIQGMSGLMDVTGAADGPPNRVGFFAGDLVTPLFACYSILAALRHREQTGEGQYLDASMMDSLVSLMFMENLEEYIEQQLPMRTGNKSRSGPSGLYSASDGDLVLTMASDDQWRRLSGALEAPELLEDPRFASFHSRVVHVAEAQEYIQRIIGCLTLQQALRRLEDADVPCAPVRTAAQVMADQHFWERGILQPMLHGALDLPVDGVASGFPVIFSAGSLPELPGAPTLGMHNLEIYQQILGLTPEELGQLQEEGVV